MGEILGAVTYLISGLELALRLVVQVVGNAALQLSVVLRRLADASAEPVSVTTDTGTVSPHGAEIRLEGVTFRYGALATPVVAGLSLTIPAGEHLVIAGPSGIGKSTLVNLVAGLERPELGTVHIGGTEVNDLSPVWLRRAIVLVPHESNIFAGTLRENLTYLAPDADDPELDHVAELFGLGEVVAHVGGYDGDIRHADDLSSGQLQLVALARTYLSRDARVVILDEGTCHLDPSAEAGAEAAFAARGAMSCRA